MAEADPISAIITVLRDDAGVTAITSGKVGWEIEAADRANMQAIVVVKPGGGPGDNSYQQFGRQRVDTLCYGAIGKEAWQVYLAVRDALKQLKPCTIDGVSIKTVTITAVGNLGVDPETQWPVCLASFNVLAAETA